MLVSRSVCVYVCHIIMCIYGAEGGEDVIVAVLERASVC